MSIRHVARRVAASVAATAAAGTFAALAFTSPASATGPAGGTSVPNSAVPQAPFTAGQPFDSGQTISVEIPANTVLTSSTTKLNIVECAAPNGVLPTNTSACDGLTNAVDTVFPAADGSVAYTAYTVYALPDQISLGESPSGSPVCGNTAATECVLYVGYNNLDFTLAHFWSQPFKVNANGTDAGSNPGDGTPEVPMAIILPLAAMGALGGTVLIRRRQAAKAAKTA